MLIKGFSILVVVLLVYFEVFFDESFEVIFGFCIVVLEFGDFVLVSFFISVLVFVIEVDLYSCVLM